MIVGLVNEAIYLVKHAFWFKCCTNRRSAEKLSQVNYVNNVCEREVEGYKGRNKEVLK